MVLRLVLNLKSVVLFEVYDICFVVCLSWFLCLSPVLWLSGGWYVYQQRNEVHNNCGIEIYYQSDMQNTHENMLLELFCQIISEPCFNTLRTKEQLGNTNTQEKCSFVCGNTIFSLVVYQCDDWTKYFCSDFNPTALKNIIYFFLCVCLSRLHCVQRPPQSQWSAGSAFHHPV